MAYTYVMLLGLFGAVVAVSSVVVLVARVAGSSLEARRTDAEARGVLFLGEPPSAEAIDRLVHSGYRADRVLAIRMYRDLYGGDLKGAKEAIDGVAPRRLASSVAVVPDHRAALADPQILALVRRGDRIAAIKRLRQLTGLSLKDAKDAIESVLAGL